MSTADSPLSAPAYPPTPNFFRRTELPFILLRVALYLILVEAFTYEFLWLGRYVRLTVGSAFIPRNLMASEFLRMAAVFAAAWVMSRLERRPFGDYGLPRRRAFRKSFWQGALFGLAEISVVLGVLGLLGYYRFGALEIHDAELLKWAGFWLIFFLAVGFFEEFTFRGYVQFALTQGIGFWPTAIITSLIFGALHLSNPGESWIGIAGVVLTGLFWCFTLRRTGSLWFAVGMHAAFDFGETFLYSVPDSGMIFPGHLSSATLSGPDLLAGGTAGPEASLLDFLMLFVFFYAVHRLYPPTPRISMPAPHSAAAQPNSDQGNDPNAAYTDPG
jgi:uncharacterized protein